ncbi:TPA: hypothetical protein ACIR6Q_004836 [Enterobacter kobei]|uniref:hypothetical protein n=1 Tax=Enterobacter cloacae complex TaxID=354276 RepID=UPI0018678F02|nr:MULTISPECIES: hypothetical protein [Enterobacter cloacae complex]ELJ5835522.1 hypothetical protein [Enterobacter kobei]MDG9915722.1 hypothetical protein [Enterobacter kobei]MDH0041256.1 hypothetical protein [Enterobacter kobei]
MKLFNFSLLVLIITTFSVSAKSITVYGGLYDCKSWVELSNQGNIEKDQVVKNTINGIQSHWLAGYMTAFNQVTGEDNFPVITIATAKDFISDYCTKNISKEVIDGLLVMREKLKK